MTTSELSYTEGVTTRSTAEYNDNLARLAREAFKDHVIVAHDARSVTLRRRRADGTLCGFYATEVVLLGFGRAIVHGDIFPVLVRFGPNDLATFCEWFATSEIGYITSKVEHPKASFDDAVFAHDVLEYLRDYAVGPRIAKPILVAVEDGNLEEARTLIRERDADAWEILGSLGRVPDPALFYAREAAAVALRLMPTLEAEPTAAP